MMPFQRAARRVQIALMRLSAIDRTRRMDATAMVMSDHGFRAEYRGYAVNKWLREQDCSHSSADAAR